jgi:PAS domain S-box-containing protein
VAEEVRAQGLHPEPDASTAWLDLDAGWLFASIRDAVVVADAQTARVVLWNPAATELFGYPPAEALRLYLPDVVDDLLATPQWSDALAGGSARHTVELFARRKDGGEVYVELTLSGLQSATSGRAFVLAVVRDVSERRQAEEERMERVRERVAHEHAVVSHRRLAVLAEASRLLDASLDYERTLQEVARVAVRTLADWCIVHLLEADGAIRWLAMAHGDPAKEALARELQERYPATEGVTRVLRTGVSEAYGGDGGEASDSERAARAHDAEHLRMLRELDSRSVMIVPLVARGRMLGAVSLISTAPERVYDKSDLAIAEELARRCGQAVDNARLHQDAQAALKARDRFVSIASHELRTPIARVKGYAEMLLAAQSDGDLTPEMLERSLKRIDNASDRLTGLVRDLLDVSKITAGNLPLRVRVVDVMDLVRDVVGRYQEQLGAGLLLDIVGTPVSVSADPERIEQVLTNLLDNAVKYSPDGPELRVRLQPKARGVLLEVSDRGIGLPPETAERIFEPFSRAANAEQRQITGMGLGLYICRNIVEQHHGRIWARSEGERSGTTMCVWLPEPSAGTGALAA